MYANLQKKNILMLRTNTLEFELRQEGKEERKFWEMGKWFDQIKAITLHPRIGDEKIII